MHRCKTELFEKFQNKYVRWYGKALSELKVHLEDIDTPVPQAELDEMARARVRSLAGTTAVGMGPPRILHYIKSIRTLEYELRASRIREVNARQERRELSDLNRTLVEQLNNVTTRLNSSQVFSGEESLPLMLVPEPWEEVIGYDEDYRGLDPLPRPSDPDYEEEEVQLLQAQASSVRPDKPFSFSDLFGRTKPK